MATVQVPLPLVSMLADAKTAFFGLCLTAGQQLFQAMMEKGKRLVLDAFSQVVEGDRVS